VGGSQGATAALKEISSSISEGIGTQQEEIMYKGEPARVSG